MTLALVIIMGAAPLHQEVTAGDPFIWWKQLNAEISMMAACRNKASRCGSDAWKAGWLLSGYCHRRAETKEQTCCVQAFDAIMHEN